MSALRQGNSFDRGKFDKAGKTAVCGEMVKKKASREKEVRKPGRHTDNTIAVQP
jgi:hypothetical protein